MGWTTFSCVETALLDVVEEGKRSRFGHEVDGGQALRRCADYLTLDYKCGVKQEQRDGNVK
jgi:hypothetical protein